MRRLAAGALALAFLPGMASAHAFTAGADLYGQFTEGVGVAMSAPELALALVPLGLFAGLNRTEGMLAIWPAFILAWLIGMPLGSFIGAWIIPVTLALGVACGVVCAFLPRAPLAVLVGAAGVIGLGVGAASFQGHGLFELPFYIHFGLFFGANLLVACVAGLAKVLRERFPAFWMDVALRSAASWAGAVALMVLAFEVAGLA